MMSEQYGSSGYGSGYPGGSGYPAGSGYPGGNRSRRGGGSVQGAATDQLFQMLNAAFTSTDLVSLTNPEAAPPVQSGPVLMNEATVAYAKGDYRLAMNLYFGHLVAEYDKADNQLALAKASRLMQRRSAVRGRPIWNLRWGVSYMVRGDQVDPQPIEETAGRAAGGQIAAGGGRGEFGRFGSGDAMDEQMQMQMQMQMEMREQYGQEQADMQEQYAEQMGMDDPYGMEMEMGMGRGRGRGPAGANAAPAAPMTPSARLASLERTMLGAEADKELVDTLGAVATAIAEGFDKRFSQGDFGRAMTDVSEASGTVESVSSEFVDMLDSTEPTPMWRPGLLFFGQGASEEVTKVAQKSELDLLIHVDVYLKEKAGGYVENISRCRLIHVPSGKSLGVSKPMSSLEFAQQSRAKGTGSKEFIDEQMENFWTIVDRETVSSELPNLTAEYARTRIGELMASGGGHSLRTLAEVRLYQRQNLLSEEEVVTAFDIVGGDEAMQLLYGSEAERLRVVHKWAAGRGGQVE